MIKYGIMDFWQETPRPNRDDGALVIYAFQLEAMRPRCLLDWGGDRQRGFARRIARGRQKPDGNAEEAKDVIQSVLQLSLGWFIDRGLPELFEICQAC